MKRDTASRRTRGFGLLEAIVAVALLGGAGVVLFSWILGNLETVRRIQEAEQRTQLQLEAQAWVDQLNPANQPAGDVELATLRLRWRSELVEPLRDAYDFGGGLTPMWKVGLYRVHLEVEQAGVKAAWQQWVAGYLPRIPER